MFWHAGHTHDADTGGREADVAAQPGEPQEHLRCETFAQDLRAQLWAELEKKNELPEPVAQMTREARAALAGDLLTKLHDI